MAPARWIPPLPASSDPQEETVRTEYGPSLHFRELGRRVTVYGEPHNNGTIVRIIRKDPATADVEGREERRRLWATVLCDDGRTMGNWLNGGMCEYHER